MPGTIKKLRDKVRSSDHRIKVAARDQAVKEARGLRLQGAAYDNKVKELTEKYFQEWRSRSPSPVDEPGAMGQGQGGRKTPPPDGGAGGRPGMVQQDAVFG
jgi:hypothetical protein